jgi:hypothetical protein
MVSSIVRLAGACCLANRRFECRVTDITRALLEHHRQHVDIHLQRARCLRHQFHLTMTREHGAQLGAHVDAAANRQVRARRQLKEHFAPVDPIDCGAHRAQHQRYVRLTLAGGDTPDLQRLGQLRQDKRCTDQPVLEDVIELRVRLCRQVVC